MRLLSIGDNCIDHYAELGKRFPGGNALNVAIYANRIRGVEADYIGVVGDDEAGDFILRQMRQEGLSTQGVQHLHGKTAVTTILIRDGERVFAAYDEGVQRNAVFPSEWLKKIPEYDIAHYTVWGFGREHVPKIKKDGHPILSCDFSSELDSPALEIMPHLDYAFFSGSKLIEKGENPEERLTQLKERTGGTVVMTLGEHGSIAHDGKRIHRGKATPVVVVDTLGTGDAFIASFLASAASGDPIPEALEKGHRAAAPVCRRLGAWGGEGAP